MKSHWEYKNGALCLNLNQKNLIDFCDGYEGPFYLYDLKFLEQRIQLMQKNLPQVDIFYAMKANAHPEILQLMANRGLGADVVSLGEIEAALKAGFSPQKIIYSGVAKTVRELEKSINLGIRQINVESLPELERLIQICQSLKKPMDIALRLNPDIDIQTHPYIATGLRDNKFGIELSMLEQALQLLRQQKFVNLSGISLHLGSQMHQLEPFKEALLKLKPIFLNLQKEFGSQVFDIGGGLGIFYEQTDLEKEELLLNQYSEIVRSVFSDIQVQLQTEPGRFLVAHCGYLISQVQYIKQTSYKTFLILDTGMNHLMRPALYEAYHQILPLKLSSQQKTYDIVGPICESADFLGKERILSEVQQGDFVAIMDAGAYGRSMANEYNLQPMPEEVIID